MAEAPSLLLIIPYPLSPGDSRLVFDVTGLSRAECEIISLIDEPPLGKNGEPTDEQLGQYSDQYRGAIAASQATVLCPLGNTATRYVLGVGEGGYRYPYGYVYDPIDCKPTRIRERQVIAYYKRDGKHGRAGDPRYGWVTTEREPALPPNTKWIIPSIHPRSVRLDALKSIPVLKSCLARALLFTTGLARPIEFGFGSVVPSGDAIGIDLETSSNSITLVGLSDGTTTWAAPWNACSADKTNRAVRSAKWSIFHNASFDIPWLEREGIQVSGRVFDTMLAAHLIQSDLYKSLEKSSTLYLDLRPFKHLSTSELARPAADAQVSALMFREQWRILEKCGQLGLFCDTIMPATRVLMGMTKHGLKVDQARLATWQAELSHTLSGLMGEWTALAGTVNPFSSAQLKRYLYGSEGLGLSPQFTKHERETTDEGAIKALAERCDRPELTLLLRIREVAKLKSTYSEVEIGPDGCVHPSYLPESKDSDSAGAATGRLASRGPNIQNQPPEARRLFVPHEEGMVLVEADFSQIELRIAAALSSDAKLSHALESSDVFQGIMRELSCDRVRTKNVVYGTLYGAGPKKLASILKANGVQTSQAECQALQEKLAAAYPQLWGWRSTVGREAVENRVLTNPFGRKRYFYAGSADIPAAIDFLPQSCAADIIWSDLGLVDEVATKYGGALLTTVHDSFLLEVPVPQLVQCVEELVSTLSRERLLVGPAFQVPVKVRVGNSWGEMEEYDERGLVENKALRTV
jgi:DNA polymerase I-like protein with 3'-5' exonuclease and polymerase domains